MKIFAKKDNAQSLPWDKDAEQALKKVPMVLRSMVRGKVEKRVGEAGRARITLADFQEAERKYRQVASGKAIGKLKDQMPTANEPGVSMVVINSCHNALAGCKNPLTDTDDWYRAIEEWVIKEDISERLRNRVKSDTIVFHKKLKVSISGCPNGCSRPQIADLSVVGFVKPEFNLDECVGCGECAAVCPDYALNMDEDYPVYDDDKCQGCFNCSQVCPAECITLTRKGCRLLAGGKLGRHPHLAEKVGEFEAPKDAILVMDKIVNAYLEHAEENERFADFWIRWDRRGL